MRTSNISFKEQVEEFSDQIPINQAYLSYIVNGEAGADLTSEECRKIDRFMRGWEYVSCDESTLDSPDYGRCAICGEASAVVTATFINKEAVVEEDKKRQAAHRKETEAKIAGLTPENKQSFEKVFNAHISRSEFNEHPEMKEAFRAKLADLFADADKKGIHLKTADQLQEKAPSKALEKPSIER